MPRTHGVAVVLMMVLLIPVSGAAGESRTQGSPLTSPANYAYGCETRWLPGQTPPFDYQPNYVGPSTCTIYQSGLTTNDTFLVPGPGTVTTARVKAGANPPQVSIATIRRYFKPNAQGQMEYTCCRGISETPPATLTPNAVTEIPVNFLVSTQQPENGNTGWWDIVAVNVLGPGNLPMADLGAHSGSYNPSQPSAFWQFPKTAPNDNNLSDWSAPNFEVLMQYSWCPSTTARHALRAACPSGAATPAGPAGVPPNPTPLTPGSSTGTGTTPATPGTTAKPAQVSSTKLTLRGATVSIRVRCVHTTTCKGKVRLRTRAKKPRTLASRSMTVRAKQSATVKLKLSAQNRRRVSKKGTKVRVEVDLGSAGKVTRNLTLKRR